MKRARRVPLFQLRFASENASCVFQPPNVLSVTSLGVYSHLEMLQGFHAKQAAYLRRSPPEELKSEPHTLQARGILLFHDSSSRARITRH